MILTWALQLTVKCLKFFLKNLKIYELMNSREDLKVKFGNVESLYSYPLVMSLRY